MKTRSAQMLLGMLSEHLITPCGGISVLVIAPDFSELETDFRRSLYIRNLESRIEFPAKYTVGDSTVEFLHPSDSRGALRVAESICITFNVDIKTEEALAAKAKYLYRF